jgi:hypothetical protein
MVSEINMWEDKDIYADYYEKLGNIIGISIFVKRIKNNIKPISDYKKFNNIYNVKSAGIIILKKINNIYNVLLLKSYDDTYDLTKGHIENDELILDAAIRECEEEANINNLNFKFGMKPIKIGNLVMYIAVTDQDPYVMKNPITNKLEHIGASYKSMDFAIKNIKPGLRPAIEWVKTKIKI